MHLFKLCIKGCLLLLTVSICIAVLSNSLSIIGEAQTQTQSAPTASPQKSQAETDSNGLDSLEKIASIMEHGFTVAAIVAGGFWAYYKVFKGRVYTSRLEVDVCGEILTMDGNNYLSVKMQIKNVGLTRVEIQQTGSGLDVSSDGTNVSVQDIQSVDWSLLTSFAVFKGHEWVEPGETINEPLLIALPTPLKVAYQLELVINSKGISWRAITIIEKKPPVVT